MAKRKKKNVIKANFKDVKVIKLPDEGHYVLRVEEAEMETSSNGNDMISLTCEVTSGEFEGNKVWHRIVFSENALWKAREALEAMGMDVPDGVMEVDPEELVGCEFGAELLHDSYEGKKKAIISEWLLADEVDGADLDDEDEDDDEDDEEEAPKKSKSRKSKKQEDDDEDDEEEDESDDIDVSSMDEDELEDLIDEHGLDVELDDYKTLKKQRKAVQEALNAEDDEDEEDEDDDATYSEDQIKGMSAEELEDLNDDLDLGIEDLDEMTKKTARRNVIKALKKKGLFEA